MEPTTSSTIKVPDMPFLEEKMKKKEKEKTSEEEFSSIGSQGSQTLPLPKKKGQRVKVMALFPQSTEGTSMDLANDASTGTNQEILPKRKKRKITKQKTSQDSSELKDPKSPGRERASTFPQMPSQNIRKKIFNKIFKSKESLIESNSSEQRPKEIQRTDSQIIHREIANLVENLEAYLKSNSYSPPEIDEHSLSDAPRKCLIPYQEGAKTILNYLITDELANAKRFDVTALSKIRTDWNDFVTVMNNACEQEKKIIPVNERSCFRIFLKFMTVVSKKRSIKSILNILFGGRDGRKRIIRHLKGIDKARADNTLQLQEHRITEHFSTFNQTSYKGADIANSLFVQKNKTPRLENIDIYYKGKKIASYTPKQLNQQGVEHLFDLLYQSKFKKTPPKKGRIEKQAKFILNENSTSGPENIHFLLFQLTEKALQKAFEKLDVIWPRLQKLASDKGTFVYSAITENESGVQYRVDLEPSKDSLKRAEINLEKNSRFTVYQEIPCQFNLKIIKGGETKPSFTIPIFKIIFHLKANNRDPENPWNYFLSIGDYTLLEKIPEGAGVHTTRISRYHANIEDILQKYRTGIETKTAKEEKDHSITVAPGTRLHTYLMGRQTPFSQGSTTSDSSNIPEEPIEEETET